MKLAVSASGLLLSLVLAGCSPKVGWERAHPLGVDLQAGIEIAQNTGFRRTASLSLVCDADGALRLLLQTRLPIPGDLRWETRARDSSRDRVLRDEDVSVFVNGIGWKMTTAFRWMLGRELDQAISDPLSDINLARMIDAYNVEAPRRVSVVGISETGVFMRGRETGVGIAGFRAACRPPAAPEARPGAV